MNKGTYVFYFSSGQQSRILEIIKSQILVDQANTSISISFDAVDFNRLKNRWKFKLKNQ